MDIVTATTTLAHLSPNLPTAADDPEARRFGDPAALSLNQVVLDCVRSTLESCFQSEVEERLGYCLYERGEDRRDWRNGYRERDILTRYGVLEKVKIPRLRKENYFPSILTARQQVLGDVLEMVGKCLLCGACRTEVKQILTEVHGYPPAESLISKVERHLEEQARAFKTRSLSVTVYRYLLLDGVRVTLRSGMRTQKRTVLVAVGITMAGVKEVIGYERVAQESTSSWRGFLMRLKERGLDTGSLDLVASDEHAGIIASVPEVFGDVAHQLCWAHRMRNAYETVGKICKADQKAVVEDLRQVYLADNARQAKECFVLFARRWKEKYPGLIASIQQDLGHLLAFFRCPKAHQKYLRTTNGIERLFRDVRAKTISFAGFSNGTRCDRWLFGIFWQANQRWQTKNLFQKG